MRPISPAECGAANAHNIPRIVLEIFNQLIANCYNGISSTVKQSKVLGILQSYGIEPSYAFANKYLDVEEIYRQAGWDVTYDKPGYNESYEASFTFTRKTAQNTTDGGAQKPTDRPYSPAVAYERMGMDVKVDEHGRAWVRAAQ